MIKPGDLCIWRVRPHPDDLVLVVASPDPDYPSHVRVFYLPPGEPERFIALLPDDLKVLNES